MASGEDTPRARRSLSTTRMEAFSDGVFSIAATLLVLDIAIHPPGTALEQVLDAWPFYLAYVVSFLTIGAGWLGHTQLTERLARTDPLLLRINLLLLLVVAFLPFPTRLVADALHHESSERVFVTMYGLTLLAIRILGFALDAYARRERLYSPPEDGRGAAGRTARTPARPRRLCDRDPHRTRRAGSSRSGLLRHRALHDPLQGDPTAPVPRPPISRVKRPAPRADLLGPRLRSGPHGRLAALQRGESPRPVLVHRLTLHRRGTLARGGSIPRDVATHKRRRREAVERGPRGRPSNSRP